MQIVGGRVNHDISQGRNREAMARFEIVQVAAFCSVGANFVVELAEEAGGQRLDLERGLINDVVAAIKTSAVFAAESIIQESSAIGKTLIDVGDLGQQHVLALGPGAQQGVRKPKGPPVYETWQDWVDNWLTARISRSPQRFRWCHQYAEHPEVADRLEALWHAWEDAWPEPLRRLAWFRDGLDHHLGAIAAEDGPLRQCSSVEDCHVLPAPLARVAMRA